MPDDAGPRAWLVGPVTFVDPRTGTLLLVDHRGAGVRLPPGGHVVPSDLVGRQTPRHMLALPSETVDPNLNRAVRKLRPLLVERLAA